MTTYMCNRGHTFKRKSSIVGCRKCKYEDRRKEERRNNRLRAGGSKRWN